MVRYFCVKVMVFKKFKTRFLTLLVSVIFILSLTVFSACSFSDVFGKKDPPGTPHKSAQGIEDRFTRSSDKIVNFAKGDSDDFHRADGYGNGGIFKCLWTADNAVISRGILNMTLTKDGNEYYGAEYRSKGRYSFGFYSVSMKAVKCNGTVSSYFIYTNRPQWDEIDIEILGQDTTKVQFNYFIDGVGGHEFKYSLGFDAAEGFHEYAFDWQADHITWYVDGKAVYRVTKDIPQNPGQIMMNVWNGNNMEHWMGKIDDSKLPVTAQYSWIGYCPSSTGGTESETPTPGTSTEELPNKNTPDSDKIANFAYGEPNGFSKSDGWSNGGMFNCTWRSGNVNFSGGTMGLAITQESGGYAGGEYRSNNKYSYGYFSVSMKPAKCAGTVSSLFTYAGPSDGSPWDEIDIEFLGKDTTKVQFNYYTNGVGNHEYLYDLGFDAAEEYHEYGFDWQADGITWYVDGKAVYTATNDIPSSAGRVMTNLWNGTGVDDWLDEFNPASFPITAQYKWIGYSASNQ